MVDEPFDEEYIGITLVESSDEFDVGVDLVADIDAIGDSDVVVDGDDEVWDEWRVMWWLISCWVMWLMSAGLGASLLLYWVRLLALER